MSPLLRAKSFFLAHKPAVLISGAGAVAALGYAQHQRAQGDPGDAGEADPLGADIAGYAPAGATGGAAYDSTGNDVYNALQPQIEQTQNMLQTLLDRLKPTKPGKPKPPKKNPPKKPPKKNPPKGGGKKGGGKKRPTKGVSDISPSPVPRHPLRMAGPTPHTPLRGQEVTVRRGQTLDSIARTHKVTVPQLIRSNRGVTKARPGQQLTIPPKRRTQP